LSSDHSSLPPGLDRQPRQVLAGAEMWGKNQDF
jgi:hypothetical protein